MLITLFITDIPSFHFVAVTALLDMKATGVKQTLMTVLTINVKIMQHVLTS